MLRADAASSAGHRAGSPVSAEPLLTLALHYDSSHFPGKEVEIEKATDGMGVPSTEIHSSTTKLCRGSEMSLQA